jgi:hypothetical protein
MQIVPEVGAEQNTMTIGMMPSDLVAMARGEAEAAKTATGKARWPANSMHWHALLSPSPLPTAAAAQIAAYKTSRRGRCCGSRSALPI